MTTLRNCNCIVAGMALSALAGQALAQDSDKLNEANSPLTPKITINFQDYYVPAIHGMAGRDSNQFLFRGLIPWKIGDAPQLLRFTLPLPTAPTFPDGSRTGTGDLTLMDLWVLPGKSASFALGPILVAPTTSDDALGSGRWQAGAAGVVILPQTWGLLGALTTYQHSFGYDRGREPVSTFTFQPIVNVNLPERFYIRSSGTWTFDLQRSASYVPVGLGFGRVFILDKGITLNAFIEPQLTVWHQGDGAPKWQIFGGINLQFPVR